MATKDFSTIQENMVAEYLDWQTVSGSGAPNFCCGDVVSEKFLGECKTHTERQKKIVFRKDYWDKIKEEAFSVGKIPVMFTDDGTQKDYNTYCIVPKLYEVPSCFTELNYTPNYKKHLNFDSAKLEKMIHKKDNAIYAVDWFEPVYLMSLETFEEYQNFVG